MKRIGFFSVNVVVMSVMLLASTGFAWEPKGNVECIAPANPGGGWDTICRTSSSVLMKTGLLKQNMIVSNMPGGSGAVAIANVITRRKGDTNLIVAASNSLTVTMAGKRTPHTYHDVIPLAQVAAEYGGLFVKADSKYKTLADLIKDLKANPKAVSFAGGSAPGSQDHLKAALFAKAVGVDPRQVVYVPFQGGGEALTALLGGHVAVAPLDMSEAAGQLEGGKIRCLGVMAEKRSSKFKNIPTLKEQGAKMSFIIWRGLYLAPGTPKEAVDFWSSAIKKMVASKEWTAETAKLGWEPVTRFGTDFDRFVNGEIATYEAVLKDLGFAK